MLMQKRKPQKQKQKKTRETDTWWIKVVNEPGFWTLIPG
jgi:hypothetical protein